MYDNPAAVRYILLPFLLLNGVLVFLYTLHPVLPLIFVAFFWSMTIGIFLGIGFSLRWVAMQVLLLPVLLGVHGYQVAGGAGAVLGIIQFVHLLDSAFVVAIITGLIAWKGKETFLTPQEEDKTS